MTLANPPPPALMSVTTDLPFCSPKNQLIPPKILRPPPRLPAKAINNDQSLSAGVITFDYRILLIISP